MKKMMTTEHSKPVATALFIKLAAQAQQLADLEQRKFVILRDSIHIYRIAALKDLRYAEKLQIVKRIKPRPKETE